MSDGAQQLAVIAERGGAALAATSSVWAWLAENHNAIAAACAMGSLAVAVAGFCVHWWYLHRTRGGKP